jgi:hypothetical protein
VCMCFSWWVGGWGEWQTQHELCLLIYVCGRVGGFKVQGLGFRQVV